MSTRSRIAFGLAAVALLIAGIISGTATPAEAATKYNITNATVTVSPVYYTPCVTTFRTPDVKVKYGKKVLTKNKDYTVLAGNYKMARGTTYRVTIGGKGAYYGVKTVPFSVQAKSLSSTSITHKVNTVTRNGRKYASIALYDRCYGKKDTLIKPEDYSCGNPMRWDASSKRWVAMSQVVYKKGTKYKIRVSGKFGGSNTVHYTGYRDVVFIANFSTI